MRNKLREAIQKLDDEQRYHDELVVTAGRARDEHWALLTRRDAAQAAVERGRREDAEHVAAAYMAKGRDGATSTGLSDAQNDLANIESALAEIGKVEAALAEEIKHFEGRLTLSRIRRDEALGEVVTAAPAYCALHAALRDAWFELRSLRALLAVIDSQGQVRLPALRSKASPASTRPRPATARSSVRSYCCAVPVGCPTATSPI